MKSFRFLALTAALAAAGLLSACGGGGGGDDAASSDAPNTALTQGPQTYRLASQFGATVALTMDTGAGTFSYSATGVNMSGSVTATAHGTYLLDTGISGSNLRAELQLKNGAIGGVLPMQNPVTGSVATALVAGANEQLILKDTSKLAVRYVGAGVTTTTCIDGSACGDFVGTPLRLTKSSPTQIGASSCTSQPGMTPQAMLALDPAACPTVNGAPTLSERTWTMAADGAITSSLTQAPNTYRVFFADFGGQVVGFTASSRLRAGTTPGNGTMGLLLPADQATQSSQLVGTWNFAAKNDSLTFEVKSLSDVSVQVIGDPTTKETLGTFALNQWGIGGNTIPTNDDPPSSLPLFVAGPWAVFHVESDVATHIGLKR
jgi:hypothetical protein